MSVATALLLIGTVQLTIDAFASTITDFRSAVLVVSCQRGKTHGIEKRFCGSASLFPCSAITPLRASKERSDERN